MVLTFKHFYVSDENIDFMIQEAFLKSTQNSRKKAVIWSTIFFTMVIL